MRTSWVSMVVVGCGLVGCGSNSADTAAPAPAPPVAPAPAALTPDAAPFAEPPPAPPAPKVTWSWDQTPDLYPLADLVVVHGDARYVLGQRPIPVPGRDGLPRGGKPQLAREARSGGARVWGLQLDIEDDFLGGAAMVADDARVYVADYHQIATGCQLTAYAADDGRQLWRVRLEGMGPIAHSKYHNRVQLRLVDGNPTVFGNESAGRYIEVREAASGALLDNTKLPGAPVVAPLAEPLFYELSNMLGQGPSYRVRMDDFIARHVLGDRYPAGESRTRAVRQAVGQLQRMPLAGGAYTLQIQITTDPGGGLVLQATRIGKPAPPAGSGQHAKVCHAKAGQCCQEDGTVVIPCGPITRQGSNCNAEATCGSAGWCSRCKCLAADTPIDTPDGERPIADIAVGDRVWTLDHDGRRVAVPVRSTGRVAVPDDYAMIELTLADGRRLRLSAGHPLAGGALPERVDPGDRLDGSTVTAVRTVRYRGGATHDLLPAGDSRSYRAGGVWVQSLLPR